MKMVVCWLRSAFNEAGMLLGNSRMRVANPASYTCPNVIIKITPTAHIRAAAHF